MIGRLVVVCGIDGSGKSTQIERLYQHYTQKNLKVKKLRLLSRSHSFFKDIENIIDDIPVQSYCELVAFERYRRSKKIIPIMLNKYDVVICDRYGYTDLAYPAAYECEMDFFQYLINQVYTPDVTFLLDLPVQNALQRIDSRGDIWEVQENSNTLDKARRAYLELVPKFNFICVDATQSEDVISNILIGRVDGILDRNNLEGVVINE